MNLKQSVVLMDAIDLDSTFSLANKTKSNIRNPKPPESIVHHENNAGQAMMPSDESPVVNL